MRDQGLQGINGHYPQGLEEALLISIPASNGQWAMLPLKDNTMGIETGDLLHYMFYFTQSAMLVPVNMEHPDEDLI